MSLTRSAIWDTNAVPLAPRPNLIVQNIGIVTVVLCCGPAKMDTIVYTLGVVAFGSLANVAPGSIMPLKGSRWLKTCQKSSE